MSRWPRVPLMSFIAVTQVPFPQLTPMGKMVRMCSLWPTYKIKKSQVCLIGGLVWYADTSPSWTAAAIYPHSGGPLRQWWREIIARQESGYLVIHSCGNRTAPRPVKKHEPMGVANSLAGWSRAQKEKDEVRDKGRGTWMDLWEWAWSKKIFERTLMGTREHPL